jgi:hypothetical protein
MQPTLHPDENLIYSNKITFLDYNAYELIYVGEYTKSRIISVIVNNNAFILTFSASVDTYDKYQKQVEQMLDSFKVN